MKTTLAMVFSLAVVALSATACDNPDSLTGRLRHSGGEVAASLQCTAAPEGRSYAMFDGSKLEATRENEAVGLNRARVKPFAAMEKEYQRVLGVVPPSIKGAEGSFDVPATRWFGEAQYSAVSLNAIADISFEACNAYVKASPDFAAAPTDETAKAECTKLMRKAWSRSPSPEEIAGCADLATKTVADEKDVARRWAYACTSVLSASQFLTF